MFIHFKLLLWKSQECHNIVSWFHGSINSPCTVHAGSKLLDSLIHFRIKFVGFTTVPLPQNMCMRVMLAKSWVRTMGLSQSSYVNALKVKNCPEPELCARIVPVCSYLPAFIILTYAKVVWCSICMTYRIMRYNVHEMTFHRTIRHTSNPSLPKSRFDTKTADKLVRLLYAPWISLDFLSTPLGFSKPLSVS